MQASIQETWTQQNAFSTARPSLGPRPQTNPSAGWGLGTRLRPDHVCMAHAWYIHGNRIHVACMVHACHMHEKRPNFSHVPCMFHAWNMKHACTLYVGHAWNRHGEARMKFAVTCMKHACFLCSFSSRAALNSKYALTSEMRLQVKCA